MKESTVKLWQNAGVLMFSCKMQDAFEANMDKSARLDGMV